MMDILALLAEEAMKEELAKEGLSGITASAAPQMATPEMVTPEMAAAPMSMGQQMGDFASNAVKQQIQPTQNLFNTVINPQSTAGDIGRSAFEYGIKQKEEPSMAPQMNPYSNPYANMANNTVGGIPSLLQNTQSGLLPFFGAR
jgi:hypothetical protein